MVFGWTIATVMLLLGHADPSSAAREGYGAVRVSVYPDIIEDSCRRGRPITHTRLVTALERERDPRPVLSVEGDEGGWVPLRAETWSEFAAVVEGVPAGTPYTVELGCSLSTSASKSAINIADNPDTVEPGMVAWEALEFSEDRERVECKRPHPPTRVGGASQTGRATAARGARRVFAVVFDDRTLNDWVWRHNSEPDALARLRSRWSRLLNAIPTYDSVLVFPWAMSVGVKGDELTLQPGIEKATWALPDRSWADPFEASPIKKRALVPLMPLRWESRRSRGKAIHPREPYATDPGTTSLSGVVYSLGSVLRSSYPDSECPEICLLVVSAKTLGRPPREVPARRPPPRKGNGDAGACASDPEQALVPNGPPCQFGRVSWEGQYLFVEGQEHCLKVVDPHTVEVRHGRVLHSFHFPAARVTAAEVLEAALIPFPEWDRRSDNSRLLWHWLTAESDDDHDAFLEAVSRIGTRRALSWRLNCLAYGVQPDATEPNYIAGQPLSRSDFLAESRWLEGRLRQLSWASQPAAAELQHLAKQVSKCRQAGTGHWQACCGVRARDIAERQLAYLSLWEFLCLWRIPGGENKGDQLAACVHRCLLPAKSDSPKPGATLWGWWSACPANHERLYQLWSCALGTLAFGPGRVHRVDVGPAELVSDGVRIPVRLLRPTDSPQVTCYFDRPALDVSPPAPCKVPRGVVESYAVTAHREESSGLGGCPHGVRLALSWYRLVQDAGIRLQVATCGQMDLVAAGRLEVKVPPNASASADASPRGAKVMVRQTWPTASLKRRTYGGPLPGEEFEVTPGSGQHALGFVWRARHTTLQDASPHLLLASWWLFTTGWVLRSLLAGQTETTHGRLWGWAGWAALAAMCVTASWVRGRSAGPLEAMGVGALPALAVLWLGSLPKRMLHFLVICCGWAVVYGFAKASAHWDADWFGPSVFLLGAALVFSGAVHKIGSLRRIPDRPSPSSEKLKPSPVRPVLILDFALLVGAKMLIWPRTIALPDPAGWAGFGRWWTMSYSPWQTFVAECVGNALLFVAAVLLFEEAIARSAVHQWLEEFASWSRTLLGRTPEPLPLSGRVTPSPASQLRRSVSIVVVGLAWQLAGVFSTPDPSQRFRDIVDRGFGWEWPAPLVLLVLLALAAMGYLTWRRARRQRLPHALVAPGRSASFILAHARLHRSGWLTVAMVLVWLTDSFFPGLQVVPFVTALLLPFV